MRITGMELKTNLADVYWDKNKKGCWSDIYESIHELQADLMKIDLSRENIIPQVARENINLYQAIIRHGDALNNIHIVHLKDYAYYIAYNLYMRLEEAS